MPEARGYFGPGFDRQTMESLRGTIERRGGFGTTDRRIEREKVQSPSSRGNVFSGIGNGSFESKASERGFTSRQGGGFRSIGRGGGFRR